MREGTGGRGWAQVGERIGGWRLGAALGQGASSQVFAVQHADSGVEAALKRLRPQGPEARARVAREIAALRGLSLPCVPRLLDAFPHGPDWCIVMERVDGAPWPGPSPSGAPAGGPWPWLALQRPTAALLTALDRLHGAQLLHLDLKPDNVRVQADGQVVLLDLGLAQPEGGEARGGTAAYASPEQWTGGAVDRSADLYAVGVMISAALAGPVGGPLSQEPAGWPRALRALGVENGVVETIEAMLAPSARLRPTSAGACLARLGLATLVGPTALLRLPGAGAVEKSAMVQLFAGPDRIFHLQTDAAHELFRRTGADRAAIEAELSAWLELGIARPAEGGRLQVERAALDRLAAEAARARAPLPVAEDDLQIVDPELVQWMWAAEVPLADAQLGALVGAPPAATAARLRALEAAGWAAPVAEGWRLRRAPARCAPPRAEARRAVVEVLEVGDPARLPLLLRCGGPEEVLCEALFVAEAAGAAGRLGLGLAVLLDVVPVAQELGGPLAQTLMRRLAAAALSTGRAADLDAVVALLDRPGVQGEALRPLLSGFSSLLRGAAAAAWAESFELLPQQDADLEDWRVGLGVMAGSALGPETLSFALERAAQERVAPPGPDTLGRQLGWTAQHLYQQERYPEAAEAYRRSAESRSRRDSQASALLGVASAALSAGWLNEAEEAALSALRTAAGSRLPAFEARAEWRLREVAYRAGRANAVDPELIDAITRLGSPAITGLLLLNEAAVAWRAGQLPEAEALAGRSVASLEQADATAARALARALQIRCGGRTGEGERSLLVAEARALPWPGITLQVLGLLAENDAQLDEAAACAADWTAEARRQRREVLAPDELRSIGALRR